MLRALLFLVLFLAVLGCLRAQERGKPVVFDVGDVHQLNPKTPEAQVTRKLVQKYEGQYVQVSCKYAGWISGSEGYAYLFAVRYPTAAGKEDGVFLVRATLRQGRAAFRDDDERGKPYILRGTASIEEVSVRSVRLVLSDATWEAR